MTLTVQLVLVALLANPAREMYGFEVTRATGLPSGTVYPILARLKDAGWLTVRNERIIPQEEGRPPRRYYKLTGKGIADAREATARAAVQLAALGVALGTPEAAAPIRASGIEIPVIADPRQPPGIVSVVSAGLDADGKPVASAAHVDIGADEGAVDIGPCVHRRPPGSYCVRCARLIGGLRLDHELSRRPSLGSRAHGEPEAGQSADVGAEAGAGPREPGVLGVLAGRSRPACRRVGRTRPGGYSRAAGGAAAYRPRLTGVRGGNVEQLALAARLGHGHVVRLVGVLAPGGVTDLGQDAAQRGGLRYRPVAFDQGLLQAPLQVLVGLLPADAVDLEDGGGGQAAERAGLSVPGGIQHA
jgi:PadR family transcriptional regulator, regulatory protein PadR